MKIHYSYFVLAAIGLWLIPLATIIYLSIGIILKIGHSILCELDDLDYEDRSIVLNMYHVVTWIHYTKTVGLVRSMSIFSTALTLILCTSFALFSLGYYGAVSPVVTDGLKDRVNHGAVESYPLAFQAELYDRLHNQTFYYSDFVWLKNHVDSHCHYVRSKPSTSSSIEHQTMDYFIFGVSNLFPVLGSRFLTAMEYFSDPILCLPSEQTTNAELQSLAHKS